MLFPNFARAKLSAFVPFVNAEWMGKFHLSMLKCKTFTSLHFTSLHFTSLHFGSSTSGNPFFGLPTITIFAFVLVASFSVASMPFHSNNCALIPVATIL